MKVNEILTRHPSCVSAGASLLQAARQMKLLDVGMLPVCENERLVGTVTDRDIVIRGIAQQLDPQKAQVRDVMTEEMVWCFEDEDIEEAARLMESRQVRRLPILNREKRLVGIVSVGDFAVRGHREQLAREVLESVSAPPALV